MFALVTHLLMLGTRTMDTLCLECPAGQGQGIRFLPSLPPEPVPCSV